MENNTESKKKQEFDKQKSEFNKQLHTESMDLHKVTHPEPFDFNFTKAE